MNRNLLIISGILFVLLIAVCLVFAEEVFSSGFWDMSKLRDTEGTLNYTVRTVTYNGAYAPRNAGAIWVTNANDQFIKTIKVWANAYRYTLVRWLASSGNNTTGAVTSASLNNHILHNVSWNARNWQNQSLPDGEYKINIEFTEHNATTNNPGKFKSLTFTKDGNAFNQTYPNETYFRDLALNWQPVIQNGTLSGQVYDHNLSIIPGAVIEIGASSTTSGPTGVYSIDLEPGDYTVTCSHPNYLSQTVYHIQISSGQTTHQDFELTSVSNSDENSNISRVLLKQNSPNPFKQQTMISFYLPKSQAVALNIYNLKGQFLQKLCAETMSSGWHEILWNGKLDNNRKAAPGAYIYRLEVGGQVQSGIMHLQK